jgi:hypothetical protein
VSHANLGLAVRRIRIFPTRKEYEEFVFAEVLSDDLLRASPFYRSLVRFVLDAKAPLFYSQSDPSEHANFSLYYNFILIRDTYTNPTLRAMYFLHDFVHLLFYYPHDMSAVTAEEFDELLLGAEYAASNETEVLAHYRVPGLRARVFPDRRLLVDLLRERGVAQPAVRALHRLRSLLVESDDLDPFFFLTPADEPVRATLKSYRGNRAWCKQRLAETLLLPNPSEYSYRFLTPTNYERVLSSYEGSADQASYERVVLRNLRLAFVLLRLERPPASFAEGLERVLELEERVLVRSLPAPAPGARLA